MKYSASLFILFCIVTSHVNGQIKSANAVTYSQPMQVDSSDYFIIGSLIDRTNKSKYNLGITYNYSLIGAWTNVFFYNSKTNQSRKVFPESIILISPIVGYTLGTFGTYVRPSNSYSALADNRIFYTVKSDEYNKDGVIDEDDPYSIYISNNFGEGLKQITPSDMNVVSWQISKDFKIMILRLQKDKNGDKKFSDEDEILYKVDLSDNNSDLKLQPIKL